MTTHSIQAVIAVDTQQFRKDMDNVVRTSRTSAEAINRLWKNDTAFQNVSHLRNQVEALKPQIASVVDEWEKLNNMTPASSEQADPPSRNRRNNLQSKQTSDATESLIERHHAAQQAINDSANIVSSSITRNVNALLWGATTTQEALAGIAQNVSSMMIDALSQFAAQNVTAHIAKNTMGSTQLASRGGQLAAETYAAAFAATAAIPLVGPALAPGVASAAVAQMTAGMAPAAAAGQAAGTAAGAGTLASFDVGGPVDAGFGTPKPILAHGGELILNPRQQQNLIMSMTNRATSPQGSHEPTKSVNININGPVYGERSNLENMLHDILQSIERSGGRGREAIRRASNRKTSRRSL